MTATSSTTSGFAELEVPSLLVEALQARGITTPTAVQLQSLPLVCQGGNLIVQAKTGTGKTLAFGLPLLAALSAAAGNAPRLLVVCPTRELALQVFRDLDTLGTLLGLRTVAVYGGADAKAQSATLAQGADIVVGTPGRLLDLAGQRTLRLDAVTHVVLDEADEMLDMGFLPDITRIMTLTERRTQTLLFSATMPAEIRRLARRFCTNPHFLHIEDPDGDGSTVARVTQFVYRTHPLDKPEILARLLQAEGRGPIIVFSRTKRFAQRLSEDMNERGFNTVALHGDLNQHAREQALAVFRAGGCDVLIATDVAARGIDIVNVTHVVNYDCPEDAATYLHRIGRTARAGRSGIAVSFVDWEHVMRWNLIAGELGLAHTDPPETFSNSVQLHLDLAIAEDTRGRLTPAVPQRRTPERDDARRPAVRGVSQPAKTGANGDPSRRRTSASTERTTERSTTEPDGTRRRPRTRRGAAHV